MGPERGEALGAGRWGPAASGPLATGGETTPPKRAPRCSGGTRSATRPGPAPVGAGGSKRMAPPTEPGLASDGSRTLIIATPGQAGETFGGEACRRHLFSAFAVNKGS